MMTCSCAECSLATMELAMSLRCLESGIDGMCDGVAAMLLVPAGCAAPSLLGSYAGGDAASEGCGSCVKT